MNYLFLSLGLVRTFNRNDMEKYRFQLEKYSGPNSRFICPNCGRKEFTKYVDLTKNTYVHPRVGRCNREMKCAYHFTPRDYYDKSAIPLPGTIDYKQKSKGEQFFFNHSEVNKSMVGVNNSSLYKYLESIFGTEKVQGVFEKYKVGTSQVFRHSTLFWQIDSKNKVRTGKVMVYNQNTGKRDKCKFNWLQRPEGTFTTQCFFGAHLVRGENTSINVGIVESEKTALICDMFFDKNFIWLASSGLRGINQDKFSELKDRRVFLFPDLSPPNCKVSAYELWKTQGEYLGKKLRIEVSINTMLEKIATANNRIDQWDIADFILNNKI